MITNKIRSGYRERRAWQLSNVIIPQMKADIKRHNDIAKTKRSLLRERVKELQEIEIILQKTVTYDDYFETLKVETKNAPKGIKIPKSIGGNGRVKE